VLKSTFTRHYASFRRRLVELRRSAGLTQRQLAARLRRERSFVARIEQGERRLDLVEFYWICRACGADPRKEAAEIMRGFGQEDRKGPSAG
jgi:transcriptional regulator with XRE-family HTH domain